MEDQDGLQLIVLDINHFVCELQSLELWAPSINSLYFLPQASSCVPKAFSKSDRDVELKIPNMVLELWVRN
jgi:hypothetical protein